MLKRTLYFSSPVYLSIRDRQLTYHFKESGKTESCPVEDLGFLLLDNRQITLSQPTLDALAENNTAVVVCGQNHMPKAMFLNFEGHHRQGRHLQAQVECSLPLKKGLWRQIVEAKINNQRQLLEKLGRGRAEMAQYAQTVKSGDSSNREAQASRIYWAALFEGQLKRRREGDPPNSLLNYGYAVLRAACARALVGSGLMPGLGLHHSNQYNAYSLADDMMEPYRPFVDETVYHLYCEGEREVKKESKKRLLSLLTCDTHFATCHRPLMIGLTFSTASLVKCLKKRGETTPLSLSCMSQEALNGYKIMWLFVFFDLPTNTQKERATAARFRKELLKDGFHMMQYSVYTRSCSSQQALDIHAKRIKALLPPAGQVSLLSITDKQYGYIHNYWGQKEKALKKAPAQLEFF